MSALYHLINKGDTVFDVGANVGCTALLCLGAVGDSGLVVAFEPAAKNIDMLRFNLSRNKMRNYRIEGKCVSESPGAIALTELDGGLSTSNSLTFSQRARTPSIDELATRTVVVQSVSIDSFVNDSGIVPQVVKIDVEGAELSVLNGALQTLRTHRPAILIGVHPFWWPDGQDPNAVGTLLHDLGYKVTNTSGSVEFPNQYADYVCIHHSRLPPATP